MSNVTVGERSAVAVDGSLESLNHVAVVVTASSAALGHDGKVKVGHLTLSLVTATVRWEREVGEHKVERSKALVEVLHEVRETVVHALTDFLALQSTASSKDDELLHTLEDGQFLRGRVDCDLQVVLEKVASLLGDQWGIRLQSFSGETVLDLNVSPCYCWVLLTNFFCCMSISLGQSYTTPFPKTGVVRWV